MADDGRWVTIEGTHVFIKNGTIEKGPAALIGKPPSEVSSSVRTPSPSKSAVPGVTKNQLDSLQDLQADRELLQGPLWRGEELSKFQPAMLKDIDELMTQQPTLKREVTLYRYVEDVAHVPGKSGIETVKGFQSCTTDRSKIVRMAEESGITNYHVMAITVTGTVKGIHMNKYLPDSPFAWQDEVLLDRNISMTRMGRAPNGDYKILAFRKR